MFCPICSNKLEVMYNSDADKSCTDLNDQNFYTDKTLFNPNIVLGIIFQIISIFLAIISFGIYIKLSEIFNSFHALFLHAIYFVLNIFYGFIYYRSRQISKLSIDKALKKDNRDHILYLRSFLYDNLKVYNVFSSKLFDIEDNYKSLMGSLFEEEIVSKFSKLGPVISIGSIEDKYKDNLGAYRVKTDNSIWQKTVIEKAKSAKYVVILVNSTPSLLWEINELPKTIDSKKFIFLIPPQKIMKEKNWDKSWKKIILENNKLPKISYEQILNEKIFGIILNEEKYNLLKSRGHSNRKYLSAIDNYVKSIQTDLDKQICRAQRSSKKSWTHPCIFIMGWFLNLNTPANNDFIIGSINLCIGLFFWIVFISGVYHYLMAISFPKEIRSMFALHIFAGSLLNIPIISLILFAIVSCMNFLVQRTAYSMP